MSEPNLNQEESSPKNEGGAVTNPSGRRGGRGNNPFRRNNRAGSSFKGATEGMNGHVFQTYAEQSKRGQFQRTLDELQVYCSITYKKEIDILEPLFEDMLTPTLQKPVKPAPTEEEGSVDEDLYKEEIKT